MELWIVVVSCYPNLQHNPITTQRPHRKETEDFTPTDPFINWEDCGKFQDLTGTHHISAKYFYQQLQHGTWTRTTCFYQGSTWKHLEDKNNQSACQRTRFLLGKVSRWFHPKKNPPDDQTQVNTFSFQIGDSEQREECAGIQDLQQPAEPPVNVPRAGTSSLTDRQSGHTSIAWNRNVSREAGHSNQFSKFLWCDTFHSSSEEINPLYKGCPTQEILSFERVTVLSVLTVWTFGTQWSTLKGVFKHYQQFSGYFFSGN